MARFSVRTGAVRSYVRGLDEELAEHDHVLRVRHGHSAPQATQKILPLTEALLGFAQEAARRLGLPSLERFIAPRLREAGSAGTPSSRRTVEAFLAAHSDVTALAAFDDDIALCSLTALRDLGRRVPEELAVIGFDETEHGSLSTPALTTVHIDAEILGRLAARSALGIDTEGLAPLPGRIVVRTST